jgi:hypothetical protein
MPKLISSRFVTKKKNKKKKKNNMTKSRKTMLLLSDYFRDNNVRSYSIG